MPEIHREWLGICDRKELFLLAPVLAEAGVEIDRNPPPRQDELVELCDRAQGSGHRTSDMVTGHGDGHLKS